MNQGIAQNAITPETCFVPKTHEGKGRRTAVAPGATAARYLHYGRITLAAWQRDVIAMVHEEMEYFVPQMQTKIMNEGWASIWHARIMRALDLSDNEHIEFANLHSGVVSPQKGQ